MNSLASREAVASQRYALLLQHGPPCRRDESKPLGTDGLQLFGVWRFVHVSEPKQIVLGKTHDHASVF